MVLTHNLDSVRSADPVDSVDGRDSLLTFHLTGRATNSLRTIDGAGVLPALFAPYRDLSELRYDLPVVLVRNERAGEPSDAIAPLSALIDDALSRISAGTDADRLSRHAFRLERALRAGSGTGEARLLSEAWDDAVQRLGTSMEPEFRESVDRLRAAVEVDGVLVDCDRDFPGRLVRHAWQAVQRRKVSAVAIHLERLTRRLSDILRADDAWSEGGLEPGALRRSVGGPFVDAFDFDMLSRVLSSSRPPVTLSAERRARIQLVLGVLQRQRFVPPAASRAASSENPPLFDFEFGSCAEALDAYRTRIPDAVALEQAIAIGELEAAGEYHRERHDALFSGFDPGNLDPVDLARLPDYLVRLEATRLDAEEQDRLEEILRLGLPMKILWQTDDLLEESPVDGGSPGVGWRSRQIASLAIGMGEVYVLQASASHLVRARDRLLDGLQHRGPALFSVYSGAGATTDGIPCYLRAAAATESRAFPTLSFDPSAGSDPASRLSLSDNPQLESDWPVQRLDYGDERGQRADLMVAFTVLDFLVADGRAARHFALEQGERWNDTLPGAAEVIATAIPPRQPRPPYVPVVDADNVLRQAVVDERLVREARRGLAAWRTLQELAGVGRSSRASQAELPQMAAEGDGAEGDGAPTATGAPAATGEPAPSGTTTDGSEAQRTSEAGPVLGVAPSKADEGGSAGSAPAAEVGSDEPYIETPRCTTCNECTQINNRMFRYNDNRQAYIADTTAGTFRQLVDAAESCQVSIIHPGQPRDLNEPGLEELLERAQSFN